MRDHIHEGVDGKVVSLSEFRRRIHRSKVRAERARRRGPATSLHIDITYDGKIDYSPLVVHRAQALVLLKIVLAISNHLMEVHAGMAS